MNKEIEKNILEEKEITSRKATPLIPLLILAAACISFAIALGMESDNSSKMPILLIAIILVILAAIKQFSSARSMIYKPTGETFIKKELFYELNNKEKILALIDKEDIATLHAKAKSNENLPIKVVIYTTASKSIAICRAYQFVPYTYEAITGFTVIRK